MGFVGWFLLMGSNGLRVGDWVEINGVVGEVVEIALLRTVLLETGNWTDTGHPTGRKVAFVNSYAIEGHFFNFSTVGQWLWDEVQIMVPSSQNPYPVIDAIQKMVVEQTAANVVAAEQEWQRSKGHYRAQQVSAAPEVSLRPTSSGIEYTCATLRGRASGTRRRPVCTRRWWNCCTAGRQIRQWRPAQSRTLESGRGRIAASFRNILQQTLFGCRGQAGAVQDLPHHCRWQRARKFERAAQWRLFIAQQRNTDLPPRRPPRMVADRAGRMPPVRHGSSAP